MIVPAYLWQKPGQINSREVVFARCSSTVIPIIGKELYGDPVEDGENCGSRISGSVSLSALPAPGYSSIRAEECQWSVLVTERRLWTRLLLPAAKIQLSCPDSILVREQLCPQTSFNYDTSTANKAYTALERGRLFDRV